MEIRVYDDKRTTSKKAADKAINLLNKTIIKKGKATIVMATGNSQIDFINFLIEDNTVKWNKVKMFHLDEYIGVKENHPASFRKYLKDKFVSKVDNISEVIFIKGEKEPEEERKRLNKNIKEEEIDVAFIGIGENGHLAFNDPPADFETKDPYIVVTLDQKCKEQQVNEGWFASLNEVPNEAISMSINQIMKSKAIICTVPDIRKAQAVKECFSKKAQITPEHPASILKKHENTYVFLDKESASLLKMYLD